ncbi:hypothetical protein F4802DRAFT_474493 [Xylaria palmicola]|nr:hypothetical protein F4802DRAFT_474493 [Xylaria palmicola]
MAIHSKPSFSMFLFVQSVGQGVVPCIHKHKARRLLRRDAYAHEVCTGRASHNTQIPILVADYMILQPARKGTYLAHPAELRTM